MKTLKLFLKICEGCGVLWLRTGATDGVYCRGCSTTLAEFPPPNPGKCRNHRIRTVGARSERRPLLRCEATRTSSTRRDLPNNTLGGAA